MASPALQIQLLGDFQLLHRGRPLPDANGGRARAVLTYLIIHRRAAQRREHLAGIFWPDSSGAQARTNLRRELHHLRHALPTPDRFLQIDKMTVQWRHDSPAAIDLATFEAALAEAARAEHTGHEEERCHALEAAVAACGGDLLPGCYDDAILEERERLRTKVSTALQDLVGACARRGDAAAAARHAARLVRHDPLNEAAHRALIELIARSGDRAGALRAFDACAAVLKRELQTEPSPETRAVRGRIVASEPATPPSPPTQDASNSEPELIPLVGRDAEWASLHAAWRAARPARPQLVLIRGDAGIGKTRLAEEMLIWAAQQRVVTARSRSYAAEGAMTYAPVVDWLRTPALRSRWAGLDRGWLAELARLMPEVAEPTDKRRRPSQSELARRPRLFEALARAVCAGDEPRALLLDDLQWCDDESIAWLHYLMRYAAPAKLLVVTTVRDTDAPADHPLWKLALHLRGREQLSEVSLGPLDAASTQQLVNHLVDQRWDPERSGKIFQQAEGYPLYIVESVRAACEDAGRSPGAKLKVHALIETRLAQLSTSARDLAGACAVVGRAFSIDVLRRAVGLDEDVLASALDELSRRGIVREQHPVGAYDFSHDRIREVAYGAVGPARSRLLHKRIAEALEDHHRANLSGVVSEVAAHFDRAGEVARAVEYYHRAGEQALRMFADRHAIALLSRARELLGQLPPTRERDRRELAILTALGVAFVVVKGYGVPDTLATYERAKELSEQLEGTADGPVLRALALASIVRSQLAATAAWAEALRKRAQHNHDRSLRVEAHYVRGVLAFWKGEFDPSRRALASAIAGYEPREARTYIAQFAQHPRVICGVRYAYTLWFLGRPEQARREADATLALARRVEHPFSLVYALLFAAYIANDSGEDDRARALAQELVARACEHEISFYRSAGEVLLAWLRAAAGEPRHALPDMHRALEAHRATGQILHRPYGLTLTAQAHALAGQPELGLVVVEDALSMSARTGQRYLDAELLRLKAELLARQHADPRVIKRLLHEALAIAKRQGALALELRVRISLVRALGQGNKGAAKERSALRTTYSRFRHKSATADLREAARLLWHAPA